MKQNWTYKKLGEMCVPKNKIERASKIFAPEEEIQYIDISSIDNSVQKMTEMSIYKMTDAPSRAQQRVKKNDILISTVRPNLKNIAIVDGDDANLVASSGFCVLRANEDVELNYIFHYVTSDIFTNQLMKLTTGANYPAVKDSDIRNSIIPLPPLSTQQSIVAELDEINNLLSLKRKELDAYDKLAQSLFYEMFGDPVENEKGWEVKKLGEIANPTIGLTYKPENVIENGTIVLRSGNIQDSEIDLQDIVRVNSKIPENKYVKAGDILMCSRNGSFRLVGKVALIKDIHEKMSYGAFMTIIRSEYNPYLFGYFKTPAFREYLIQGKTTTVNQITVKMLQGIILPIPPQELQQLFATRIEAIEEQKANVKAAIEKLETLLAARMQYWFE